MPKYSQCSSATLAADRRDAAMFATLARLNLTARGRLMLLSGLAAFNRNVATRS